MGHVLMSSCPSIVMPGVGAALLPPEHEAVGML